MQFLTDCDPGFVLQFTYLTSGLEFVEFAKKRSGVLRYYNQLEVGWRRASRGGSARPVTPCGCSS